jgi:hypothetical protein
MQNRVKWEAFAEALINLHVPKQQECNKYQLHIKYSEPEQQILQHPPELHKVQQNYTK